MCNTNYCIYKDKECKTKKCKDITDEFSCTYILNIDETEAEICAYVNDSCQEMDGPETLTSLNCMSRTLGTYYWNLKKNECIQCEGWGVCLYLLFFIVLLYFWK